jgi:hypothetical protein
MIIKHKEPKYNCDTDNNNLVLILHLRKSFLRQRKSS